LKVRTDYVSISTEGEPEMVDITDYVQQIVSKSGIGEGNATVFVSGSTAAVTTIEYENGLLVDFPRMLERVAPKKIDYEHEKAWHDGNGHSHVRASLLGPSLTVPFAEGRLLLGTWQQIVFVELDNRPRKRKFIVQVIGE
jgi:secondary thiamine-phosphate synthase enzyme